MNRTRRRIRGFTLLELLVVVVIIGIVASVFTLAIGVTGSAERELAREADRLAALLELALEDATFQNRQFGLRFYPDAYEFSIYEEGEVADPTDDKWIPLGSGPFKARKLPELFTIDLYIEARRVNLERSARDVEKEYRPQLFLFSSGDISDTFEVVFRTREADDGVRLTATPLGEIEVKHPDED